MYPSEKPYPRLQPPMFLSPIKELEEEVSYLSTNLTKSDSNIFELNNSSLIPSEISQTTSISSGTGNSKIDISGGPRTENVYIESCSGRKHEDVEVIKQKYINSEIQDLPGLVREPIRYGPLYRTRSTHLNLGSQDIREQMNRIRLKPRISLTQVGAEKQQEYRCKKFTGPNEMYQVKKKSVEEILYGEIYNCDDYDPELASLFDNYIEECDNITRKKEEPVKYLSPFQTGSSTRREDEERISERQLELDTERAFLRGYLEGLKRAEPSLDTDAPEKCMKRTVLNDEALASHRSLISRQQDLTHTSLREWEKKYGTEQEQREGEKEQRVLSLPNGKCHSKCRLWQKNKSVPHEVQNGSKDSPEILDKDTDSIENPHSDNGQNTEEQIKAEGSRAGNPLPSYREIFQAVNGNMLGTFGDQNEGANDVEEDDLNSQPLQENKGSNSSIGTKSSSQIEEDRFFKKLVREKLEQKLLSARALEEIYLRKLKSRVITNDCKPQVPRKSRNESKGLKSNISKVEANGKQIDTNHDELDGWITRNKAFNDQDNAQMSSSELLHPVESSENVFPPMWRPSSSTSLFTIENQKSYKYENSSIPPTSSPVEAALPEYKRRGNQSSKKGLGVTGDYKKAADLVKLRLTKSNHAAAATKEGLCVDKSFANVPLSRCISHALEQNLRSSVRLTASINLSEKFAQQLKELSRKSEKGVTEQLDNTVRENSEPVSMMSSSSTDVRALKDNRTTKHVSEYTNLKADANSLQNMDSASIPRRKCQDHSNSEQKESESVDLPPISVRSLPRRNSEKVNHENGKSAEDDGGYRGNRGLAVRAGACTSAYLFDKEDSRNLQIKAKSLPPLHKVCTSCGFISDSREDKRKTERKLKTDKNETDNKDKQLHSHCCGCDPDDKWKLDRDKLDDDIDLPTLGVEKLEIAKSQELKADDKRVTQIVMSPTSTKHKCEEMSIRFMDRNIKFHFQCDVSVDNTSSQNSDQTGTTTDEWLNSLSAPKRRARYQCPVATETRIYKEDFRKNYLGRYSTSRANLPSSYLDYCKYKSNMQAKRNKKMIDRIEFISDTCLTDEVYMRAASKRTKFPVIPIKKRQDSYKSMQKYASSGTTSCSGSPVKEGGLDLSVKSTKPARLSTIKRDPVILFWENTNNNGLTHDVFYDDISDFYIELRLHPAQILKC